MGYLCIIDKTSWNWFHN